MPIQNPARRHHYIPQFYLSRWANADGRFVEFSKPFGDVVKPRFVHPKQTGWEDKLYALHGLREEFAQIVEERFFRPVDTRAADVLVLMEARRLDLSGRDRVAWGQFLLTLALRTPEHVRATISRMHQLMENPSADDERKWRKQRRPDDPKTMREAINDPDIRAKSQRKALESLMEVSSSEKIGNALINMTWGTRHLPFNAPALLTSDRPLQWFGALGEEGCHIILPVGPKDIFWATNSKTLAFQIQCLPSLKFVEFLNNHVVRRARRFVYAKSNLCLAEVQKKMGVEPEMQIPDRFWG